MKIGRKVILRSMRYEDSKFLMKWYQDLELIKYYDLLPPPTYAQIEKKIGKRLGDKNRIDLIIENRQVEAVGMVYLKKIDWKNSHAELHVMIAEKSNQGRLFGAEAGFLMLNYAFQELNLNKIYCRAIEYASEVQGLINHCGFKKEAVCQHLLYQQGKYWNVNIYGILKEEFERFIRKDGKQYFSMSG